MPTLDFTCCAACEIVVAGQLIGVRHWDIVTGTAPTVETTNPLVTGGRSYRWNTVGAAAARRLVRNLAAANRQAVVRVAIYFTTLPDIDVTLVGWGIVTGGAPLLRYRSATQDLVPSVGVTNGSTGFAVTTGVWYYITLVCDTSVSPRTCSAQVTPYGGSTTDLGSASSAVAAADLTDFRTGPGCTGELAQTDMQVTAIAHSLTVADYPIAPGVGVGLRPRADGTHSFDAVADFQYNDTTNMPSTSPTDTWTYIDDPLDNITDFLAANAAGSGEYLEWLLDAMPGGVASINGVEVVSAHHSQGTAANKQTLRLVDGATVVDVFTDVDFSVTVIVYNSKQYAAAPSGGVWTTEKVDALKVRWGPGWGTVDIAPVPYLDGVRLEVDYVPSAVTPRPIRSAMQAVKQSSLW